MRIPKRFKLHEAAAADTETLRLNVIRVTPDRAIATDGVVVASVPVLPPTGSGLFRGPQWAGGESVHHLTLVTLVDPRAWAEAVRGTKGDGELTLGAEHRATPSSDKPATVFPPARGPIGAQELPPAEDALLEAAAIEGFEVCLDAEALVRLQRALGAEEGVRLRFSVDRNGRCSSAVVAVEPVDGSPARGAIMPIVREGHR